jgi:hypothetical protein
MVADTTPSRTVAPIQEDMAAATKAVTTAIRELRITTEHTSEPGRRAPPASMANPNAHRCAETETRRLKILLQ